MIMEGEISVSTIRAERSDVTGSGLKRSNSRSNRVSTNKSSSNTSSPASDGGEEEAAAPHALPRIGTKNIMMTEILSRKGPGDFLSQQTHQVLHKGSKAGKAGAMIGATFKAMCPTTVLILSHEKLTQFLCEYPEEAPILRSLLSTDVRRLRLTVEPETPRSCATPGPYVLQVVFLRVQPYTSTVLQNPTAVTRNS